MKISVFHACCRAKLATGNKGAVFMSGLYPLRMGDRESQRMTLDEFTRERIFDPLK